MASEDPTKMILFHIPKDKDLLAAFGEVALRHEQLNYVLRMTIRMLGNLEAQEAIDATAFESSSSLRSRIRALAKKKLGEGQALLKLQAILERCRKATDKRNGFVHSVWGKEIDGELVMHNGSGSWERVPTVEELKELSLEIFKITQDINAARFEGFLAQALNGPEAD